MIHGFNEIYLEEVQHKLGIIVDFLAYYLKFSNKEIEDALKTSKTINFVISGHPHYCSGLSGVELCELLKDELGSKINCGEYEETLQKTPEYWTGWALAFFSWYTCKTPQTIFYGLSYEKVLSMYLRYHQLDLSHFVDDLNELLTAKIKETNLKIIRQINGLSQSELANISGVSLRSIQLYEQRVNDIDKAQSHTLFKLAKSLHCDIESLLENPQND